jgi:hypothetical protein
MNQSQTFSTALTCTISDLEIEGTDGSPILRLEKGISFQLKATITFSDGVEGEFASLLMPAGLAIRTTFYAKSEQPGSLIELGTVLLHTETDQLRYTAIATVSDPIAVGLHTEYPYQILASVRVGTAPFASPSLMRGELGGLSLPSSDRAKIPPIQPIEPEQVPILPVAEVEVVEVVKSAAKRGSKPEKEKVGKK